MPDILLHVVALRSLPGAASATWLSTQDLERSGIVIPPGVLSTMVLLVWIGVASILFALLLAALAMCWPAPRARRARRAAGDDVDERPIALR